MTEEDKLKTKVAIYQQKLTSLVELNIDLSIELQAVRDELEKVKGDS